VAVTSVVIAGGLALDSMSSFPPLRMLGLLGAIVISLALLADLLLLPALLVLLHRRGLGLTRGPER
jgi:predicted RND superfamily exporter protein